MSKILFTENSGKLVLLRGRSERTNTYFLFFPRIKLNKYYLDLERTYCYNSDPDPVLHKNIKTTIFI